ncbi:leucine-rich repeat serine/threonine-protein kinase 1 [Trachemys scripta elegans]|uniref:leucine-rich repeat serine/threonine-protein kinase 1 n=1 Tax=Trachemys scripta elegans TaxID=31138 RepID=UPI0015525300|nr:leucine-rich repeat serine/threonine-protein kinase 1 [Trachemys scripta elegans]
MGGKQSTVGDVSVGHSPVIGSIQDAYKSGDTNKAQELIKLSCEENILQVEKCQLLSIASAYGDLHAVRYLLKEALVGLPTEPNDDNPAVVAAYFGHEDIVKELLDSLLGPSNFQRLLNWMLAISCQQGHLAIVKFLILTYNADPGSCAVRKNEFPILTRLPLYAAIKAGNEDIAVFLLQNGACFCSYILMDSPDSSKHLLRKYFIETALLPGSAPAKTALSVGWSNLKLPWVDLDWLIDISCQITELDLSANCLASLPSVIPWGLINLRKLNLSDNQLTELPSVQSSDEIICTRLLEVDVSINRLCILPSGFLHLTKLQKLIATKNYLEKLFDEESATNWIGLRKLQELDVSDNRLVELPTLFLYCFKSLTILNVSKNNLKVFPDPWACPLKCCKASRNSLESLPDTLAVFWKNHLREVDFSENSLNEVPQGLFQLEALVSLKLLGNQLVSLPSQDKWTCKQLKSLDLSKNQLGKSEEGFKTKRISFFTTRSRVRAGAEAGPFLEFPAFLNDSLEVLYLNDNQLDTIPQSICLLKGLTELYLGNNPGIRELPPELGQLANLWQLDIEELNISNIPAEIIKEGPKTILAYLRAQLRKAEKCKLMKMIIVGPPRQGKSTLIEILQTGKAPQMMHSDATIRTTKWELQKPAGLKAKIDSVQFNVWDIGGPASMSTVNQCFFTDKALYVVVWNLALGEEAVANLQFWLLNIEAKAPNSVVLVVGTHLDLIETKFRVERIATLRAYVLALCRSPSGSRATGFPDITFKHLHELSCRTLEGLDGLRQLIFQVTCNMKDVGSSICSQMLAARLIPRSYLSLQEAVLAEQQKRSQNDDVQYLTDKQIEQIVEQTPGNDIKDYEDLQAAISFLIETGTLLHFPDTSHGLRNLYFLDPVWLSECLQRIFNIKSSKSVAKNGLIKAEDFRMLLVGTGFTEQTEEQYFQFLAKFEIALPVANNRTYIYFFYITGRLFLENSKLEYSENENNVLGQGGSGTIIYQAKYQGKPVAVKRYQIKKCKSSPNSATDTMLKHLRAMDAMKNFSEFRQEASMLHSLQHPCIVSLIGISIHPLCFALELAPLGSLTTVLSGKSKGASFVPLGHMLTQKIAYQIATGLAYLHKKNIIFCDLKSDNILVWSLDIKEHVNIKLSDYGISRQSFHEGALGVEGTPGYQAPEIRPRIVYDEKVDMFSYGMVLYELLSGQRPVLGQHQLQIAKKLSKGIRPILGQPGEVQFHRMQTLMMECWDTKPEKRPLAISVVGQMKDPTFSTFMYLLCCGKQSSFFSSQGQEYTVVFWDGKEDTRNYTVVNTEKGLIEVERMSCPGMKLCCQLKVQSALWTATEDQKIYVYGLQGMCPLNTPQKGLDTPATVSCFLAVPVIKKNSYLVLAGLSDGLVAVFSVARGIPEDSCSYLCSHTANRSKFNILDSDPRQNPYPVKAMEITNSGAEVWYSNGPGILIIDCVTIDINRRLEPYNPPSVITSMACNSEYHGEEVIWCLDDKTNYLVMYHTATYQLCARYFCGDRSPLRDMFTIQQPSAGIPATTAVHRTVLESNSLADMSIIYSPELGTQILNHQDSLTDYCSVSSYSSSPSNRITRSFSSLPSSPASSSSAPFSMDCEESDKFHELIPSPDRSENDATPTDENTSHLQAVKILPVKDLIWIPRRGGDIIVIGLEKECGTQRGRVIAVLKAGELAPYGALVEAAIVARDTVVCCFENKNMEWCLAVWRSWGAREFDIFYQSYEELGRLETCMRKRR